MLDGFPSSSKSPLLKAFVANVSQDAAESSQARARDRPSARPRLFAEHCIELLRNNQYCSVTIFGREGGVGRTEGGSGTGVGNKSEAKWEGEATREWAEAERSTGRGREKGRRRERRSRNGISAKMRGGKERGGGKDAGQAGVTCGGMGGEGEVAGAHEDEREDARGRPRRAGRGQERSGPTTGRRRHEGTRTKKRVRNPSPAQKPKDLAARTRGGVEAHEAGTNVSRETFVPR